MPVQLEYLEYVLVFEFGHEEASLHLNAVFFTANTVLDLNIKSNAK